MEALQSPPAVLSLPLVDCVNADHGERRNTVHCNIGLFGGNPHTSICKVCSRRSIVVRPDGDENVKPARSDMSLRAVSRAMICERCIYFRGGELDGETGFGQVKCERSRTGTAELVDGECRAGRWQDYGSPEETARLLARLKSPGASEKLRLQDFFGWVFVISLKRTPDRLAKFWERFPVGWPFKMPAAFEAIDADHERAWEGWQGGGGAYGCWRSWMSILATCLAELPKLPPAKRGALLVMEDDCEFVEGGVQNLVNLVTNLPVDWEIAFPGGQHFQPPVQVLPGVVRCRETGRTHCVMINSAFAAQLYQFWLGWDTHVDHGLQHWCRLTPDRKFYAADPFCAIQRANWSTIRWRQEPARSWDIRISVPLRSPSDVRLVLLRSLRFDLDSLRSRGLVHMGYWRDDRGVDNGVVELMGRPQADRPGLLREWINLLRVEAAAFPNACVGIWWPDDSAGMAEMLAGLGIEFSDDVIPNDPVAIDS
jgi:hypothetical protein